MGEVETPRAVAAHANRLLYEVLSRFASTGAGVEYALTVPAETYQAWREHAEEMAETAAAWPYEDVPHPLASAYAGSRPGLVANYETHADRALADRVVVDDGPRVQTLAAFDPSIVVAEVEVVGYRDHPSFDIRLDNGTVRSWPAGLVREVPPSDTGDDTATGGDPS